VDHVRAGVWDEQDFVVCGGVQVDVHDGFLVEGHCLFLCQFLFD